MSQLWNKGHAVQDWVLRFTVGDDYLWDALLLPYDAQATRAHAQGLTQIGVLTADEMRAVHAALDALEHAIQEGKIEIRPEDEDAHTVIEHFLVEKLGETGKKIHTGRSRNDQVLAALRLFLRDALAGIATQTRALAHALIDLAEAHPDVLLPGYTHLQRAMPSSVGLWAAGYVELLLSDLTALEDASRQINVSPLGSAAGYGVPLLDLPREFVATALGFAAVQTHVTSVQLSRGKLELHAAHALVQVGATINRLASDLVLYATAEFGFVTLPHAFTTGSSIMPQKRNPDVLELARATYHRVLAEMHVLLTLPANLSSGYHRDLQLTKEAILRAVRTTSDVLTAMTALIPGVTFNRERTHAALSADLFATEDALRRVVAGTPFREAYREAAANVSNLTVPSAEGVLSSYATLGTLGNLALDSLKSHLQR